MEYEITRRQILGALNIGAAAVVESYLWPLGQGKSGNRVDLDQFNDTLEIPINTTYTIQTGGTETYDSVLWEGDNATLKLESNAALKITTVPGN